MVHDSNSVVCRPSPIRQVLKPRFQYFETIGSGGDRVWKELIRSGGGAPSLTTSLLLAAGLVFGQRLVYSGKLTKAQTPVLFGFVVVSFSFVGLLIATNSQDNAAGYATQKIGAFLILTALLLVSSLSTKKSKVKSYVTYPFALLSIIFLCLQGIVVEKQLSATTRISQKMRFEQIWITTAQSIIQSTGTSPVGCLTVTQQGRLVKPDNWRDYTCTRLLSNLAGGEERLIGIHAYTAGTYDALQMYGSLQHYLGLNLDETVLIFDQVTDNFLKAVTIKDLGAIVALDE